MAIARKSLDFYTSEEGVHAQRMLASMTTDSTYNTESSYSANHEAHPTNLISFVDKHMKYLSEHQSVDVEHYLSNLRLMTRIR